MEIDREQLIFALSNIVDLVGVDELLHSKRVAYMVWQCAQTLGYDDQRRRFLFHLALLHDCGVSTTETRYRLVSDLEWEGSDIHCKVGANRMQSVATFSPYALPILHHHDRWEKLASLSIPDDVRMDANLIFLLDRVDYLSYAFQSADLLAKRSHVRYTINKCRGTLFQKDLLDAFLDSSSTEAFWFSLNSHILGDFIAEQKHQRQGNITNVVELLRVAELFAEIVDAKSTYTATHSRGVAEIAVFLAQKLSFHNSIIDEINIAALLHDIGKLQVPDRFLESTAPLVDEGLSYMRHHSYATYHILHNINGMGHIAEWAGNHHEALDGSGYPFHKTKEELDIQSRIIALADIFQALAQDRPYRRALQADDIISFIAKSCDSGRLDKEIFAVIKKNDKECYKRALLFE